jgi:hypothetical protein
MVAPTTTGTYVFAPPLADLIIAAFGRCQIRRPAITVEHLQDAATACNLLQVEWANHQVNLWTVDLQSIALVQGTTTYNVDEATIMIMAAYIETTVNSLATDRIVTSIDRDTYASFPDKTTQGQPTVYWYNKQRAPTITVWQPPDATTVTNSGTLKFYRARQIQDASATSGLHPEVPYYFLEAYTAALAVKLGELYAPSELPRLISMAKAQFDAAANRNVENAPWRIVPAMSTYTSSVYG